LNSTFDTVAAVEATYDNRAITANPFNNAAGKRIGLRRATRQQAFIIGYGRALVEERLPILPFLE
jgi:hypothetical protein